MILLTLYDINVSILTFEYDTNHLLNSTISAVILSLPYGLVLLGLIFRSKNSFSTSCPLIYGWTFSFSFFSNYCLSSSVSSEKSSPDFSHTPSQPIIKKWSPYFLSIYFMSGMHVIGCLWNASPGVFLWLKSPIDLVRFRPLTRPWII